GGSHSPFDVDDFSNWKDRFLVYLDGLEPYLFKILENGPYIQDTKIAALRLKFNTFKALEGEKVKETYTRMKILLNELENKDVKISQAEVNVTFVNSLPKKWLNSVEEDTRSSSEFLADLNADEKGLVAVSFDWYEESLSSEDEGDTTVKSFMAIAEDEPIVGKTDVRSDYTNVDLHYVEDWRKNLLSKFNSLKQELSLCKSGLIDLKNTKVHNISLQNEVTRLNLDNESLRDEFSNLKKAIKEWTSSKVT
ncbi:hypothetical protein Tco_1413742, partial [Tanacetum coccineum]